MPTTKLIRDLTDAEVQRVCRDLYNIDTGNNPTRNKSMAMLKAAGVELTDKVEVPDDEQVVARRQIRETAEAAEHTPDTSGKTTDQRANEWVDIWIDSTESSGGEEPVFVGVNGVGQWVPRNQICRVRRKYAEQALGLAVKSVIEPDTGPMGGVREVRYVPSYPWRIVNDPSREMVA